MNASIPQLRQRQPVWLSTVFWLAAFLSPTAYFVMVLLAGKFHINLPQTFVGSLFFLIPVLALLFCEWMVWSFSKTVGRRIGWMLVTLLAMSLQFAMIVTVLRMILVTAIGYPQ